MDGEISKNTRTYLLLSSYSFHGSINIYLKMLLLTAIKYVLNVKYWISVELNL